MAINISTASQAISKEEVKHTTPPTPEEERKMRALVNRTNDLCAGDIVMCTWNESMVKLLSIASNLRTGNYKKNVNFGNVPEMEILRNKNRGYVSTRNRAVLPFTTSDGLIVDEYNEVVISDQFMKELIECWLREHGYKGILPESEDKYYM